MGSLTFQTISGIKRLHLRCPDKEIGFFTEEEGERMKGYYNSLVGTALEGVITLKDIVEKMVEKEAKPDQTAKKEENLVIKILKKWDIPIKKWLMDNTYTPYSANGAPGVTKDLWGHHVFLGALSIKNNCEIKY